MQLYLQDYASGKALLFNRDYEAGQVKLMEAAAHLMREKRKDKRRKSQFMKLTPRRDVRASRRQSRAI